MFFPPCGDNITSVFFIDVNITENPGIRRDYRIPNLDKLERTCFSQSCRALGERALFLGRLPVCIAKEQTWEDIGDSI